jgi:hypothetical protein
LTPGNANYAQYQGYNQEYGIPTTAAQWDAAFVGTPDTWTPPVASNAADSYSSAPTALDPGTIAGYGISPTEFDQLFAAQDPFNINGTVPVSFPGNPLIGGFDEAYASQIASDVATQNTYAASQLAAQGAYQTALAAYNEALAVTDSAGAADQAAQTAWQNDLTQYWEIENPVTRVNYGLGAFQNGDWGGASSSGWTNGPMALALLQLEGEAVGASYPALTPQEIASPAYAAAVARNPGTINTLEASLPALLSAVQGLSNDAQDAAEVAQAASLSGDLTTYESGLTAQQAADYANAKQYQLAQINLGLGLSSGAASGPIGTPLTFNDASAGSGSGGYTVAQAPEVPVSPADPSNAEIGGVFGGGTGLYGGPNGAFTSGSGSVNIGADNIGDPGSGFSPAASAPFVGDASNIGFGQGQGTPPAPDAGTVDIGTPYETSPVPFTSDGTGPGDLPYDIPSGVPMPGYTPAPDTTPDMATPTGAYGGGPPSYPVAPPVSFDTQTASPVWAPPPPVDYAPSMAEPFSDAFGSQPGYTAPPPDVFDAGAPPIPYSDISGQAPFSEPLTAAAPAAFDPSAFTGAFGGGSPEPPLSTSADPWGGLTFSTPTVAETMVAKAGSANTLGGIADALGFGNTLAQYTGFPYNIDPNFSINTSQPLLPQLVAALGNAGVGYLTDALTAQGTSLAQIQQAVTQQNASQGLSVVAPMSSDGNSVQSGIAPDPYGGGLITGYESSGPSWDATPMAAAPSWDVNSGQDITPPPADIPGVQMPMAAQGAPQAGAYPPADFTGVYNSQFSQGGPLAGQADAVYMAAMNAGIPPDVLASVMALETGYGTSPAVTNGLNPAGLMGGPNASSLNTYPDIQSGIVAAAVNAANDWNSPEGQQTVTGMGGQYAPVGADNDPNGTNAGWIDSVNSILSAYPSYDYGAPAQSIAEAQGFSEAGPGSGTEGPAAQEALASGVPQSVLDEAYALVAGGANTAQLQAWMASNGFAQYSNWCAEFVSDIYNAAGIALPAGNSKVASTWNTWGDPVLNAADLQPGDILSRTATWGGQPLTPGQVGGHIAIIAAPADPDTGTFTVMQGNPAQVSQMTPAQITARYPAMRSPPAGGILGPSYGGS